jgi:predicted ATP-grasp superfamily ATP-dependent carboligase
LPGQAHESRGGIDLPRGKRVIVTSAQERFALAAVRSLARAGYRVVAVADVKPAAGHWSRFPGERHLLVDARSDADAFVDGLAEIAGGDKPLLLPGTDAALMAVSSRRERLEPYTTMGLPPHDAVDASTDKIRLQEASKRAGLAAPEAVVCVDAGEGVAAAGQLGFPVVVKARRTFFDLDGRIEMRGSAVAGDSADLERLVEGFGSPFLVQRAISGSVYSAAGVVIEEGLLSFAAARYLRTFPAEGGNVAFGETIVPPPGLRDGVEQLLGELGWRGIFELELIRDEGGRFHAIDLNPRLYGSLALATAAGTPFAVIWCEHLLGRTQQPSTARPGVRYRWEEADLRYAFAKARRGRLHEAASALAPRRRVVHAYFALRDPAPLLARAIVLLKRRGRH